MKALILGVAGQDGGYLARLLLEKGYEVVGTSRDALAASFANLHRLGIHDDVQTASAAVNDFRSILTVMQRHRPDEIYNLAGQTSVGLSFEQPVETMESIAEGTLNVLEAIRFMDRPIRFYNAGSGECFGDTRDTAADEQTAFWPRSPYAVAKSAAHWLVRNYRESHGLRVCTGVLFNHESPLRPERFVTQKIVRAAAHISAGSKEKLTLGNMAIKRDWGWAPEYVEAMWLINQQKEPEDLVVATGRSESLEYFTARAFAFFGLDWHDHVSSEKNLFRPSDIATSAGNPARAKQVLGWSARTDVDGVIDNMCAALAGDAQVEAAARG